MIWYNRPQVRDKPLGASEFVRLIYCDASTNKVMSNSLDIDFIRGDILGRSCKIVIFIQNEPHHFSIVFTMKKTLVPNRWQIIQI